MRSRRIQTKNGERCSKESFYALRDIFETISTISSDLKESLDHNSYAYPDCYSERALNQDLRCSYFGNK